MRCLPSSVSLFAPSQEGKYLQAVIQYGKIVSWLEMEYGLSEKESKASDSFLLAAFLNLAMCYLKLREYTKAVECCDKVGGRGFAFTLPSPVLSPPEFIHVQAAGCKQQRVVGVPTVPPAPFACACVRKLLILR